MAANSTLAVANVNFDDIKQSLKNYLSSQANFKDFDFTGSNLNTMLDILAYNTYLQNFYLNMVASEGFIDSAQLRNSVVSHAKTLNYTPQSFTSSKAVVDLQIFAANTPANIIIPQYTQFTASVDSNTYTFTTNESRTIAADANGDYIAANLELFEGEIINELFTVSTANTNQRFVMNNKEIDTDSLVVTVFDNATDQTNSIYTKSLSTIGLSGSSNVYFLQACEDEKYEVKFGDNVLGRQLTNGNVVRTKYRLSSANTADSANSFTLVGDIQGYSNVTITTTSSARGGGFGESIDTIKTNAPRSITVQDRTVTVQDYKTLLKQEFNDIESLNVFGGEELDPPEFGKVIVSVDLKNADGIPESRQADIKDFLTLRSPVSIRPKIVNPVFLNVDVKTIVRYNPNITVKSDNEMKTIVSAALDNFADTNINAFNSKLRKSQLVRAIDDSDPAILNNDTEVTLQKEFLPTIGTAGTFVLEFNNELVQELPNADGIFLDGTSTITSSDFTFGSTNNCSLRDNGQGVVQIVKQENQVLEIINNNIGSIDYASGKVTINELNVAAFSGSGINITAVPVDVTLVSSKNIILQYNKKPEISIIQERV